MRNPWLRLFLVVVIMAAVSLLFGVMVGEGEKLSAPAPIQSVPLKPATPAKKPAKWVFDRPVMVETKAPEVELEVVDPGLKALEAKWGCKFTDRAIVVRSSN